MRSRFIQRSDGKLIPAEEWHDEPRAGYFVMPDIKPYKSMCDGSMITSRSKHREHLKVHGVVEVGNDLDRAKRKSTEPPPGLKQRIIEIANEKLRY